MWGDMKSSFRGAGGYQRFMAHIGLLMLRGEVEGSVGERAVRSDWWRAACAMAEMSMGMGAVGDDQEVAEEVAMTEGEVVEGMGGGEVVVMARMVEEGEVQAMVTEAEAEERDGAQDGAGVERE